jgi:hypothetical protein
MIKMVCSDLDGTLIQYGDKGMSDEIFAQIRRLAAHGIRFCPASGRQYESQKAQFAPVAQHCVFVCENGAVLFDGAGRLLGKTPMPRALAEEIARDFWARSDGKGEVMLSGENTAYLLCRTPSTGMAERVRFIGNNARRITDPAEVPEAITKVSLYIDTGVEPYVERFVPRWREANAAVAGPKWIDTTFANKGIGVRMLCERLGIRPDEVMAFGDNYNDAPMLDVVGEAYIMDSAAAPLRARYARHTPRPEDVLREFLARLDAQADAARR